MIFTKYLPDNKIFTLIAISWLLLFVQIDYTNAATPGNAYVDTYTYQVDSYESCDWNFYTTIYACLAPSSYPWCVNATPIDDYVRCSDCGGAGSSYATLYKSSCKDIYWCDNLPTYSPGVIKVTEDKTGYTCHYVSSVNSWSACSYDSGTQSATDVTWSSFDSTSPINNCSDYQVSLSRPCGVCEPSTSVLPFVNEAAVYAAPPLQKCKWGSIPLTGDYRVTFPDIYGENWNWRCVHGGIPSDICTAKMSYTDIGLRINAYEGVVGIAAETQPDNCKSPFKVAKNGHVWCIGLLPDTLTTHIRATRARIKTSGGVKMISKLPYSCDSSIPPGSYMCAGDDIALTAPATWTYKGNSTAFCTSAKCEYYTPVCTGAIPAGSIMCAGDNASLTVSAPWTYKGNSAATCTAAKCEYYTPVCTGTIPAGSVMCTGDNTGLTTTAAWTYRGTTAATCTAAKCEYYTPCVPNCSNAPNICAGTPFSNGCGGTCYGTKYCCTPSCANAPNVCAGTPFSNGCGGTCYGTRNCCTPTPFTSNFQNIGGRTCSQQCASQGGTCTSAIRDNWGTATTNRAHWYAAIACSEASRYVGDYGRWSAGPSVCSFGACQRVGQVNMYCSCVRNCP